MRQTPDSGRTAAYRLTLLGLTSLSGALALAHPAAAQTAETEATRTLEAVTVTATKREENLQDIAVSVTAIDPDGLALISAGGDDLQYLSARVPSVVVESSFGRIFPRFYIRGLGNTDFDLNASQPVSLVYDDIVYENPLLKGFPVFDTERVEVLRGPQGTLFGRNTPAGIVKFDSVKPGDAFDAYARTSLLLPGQVQFEGAVGGPVNDLISLRTSMLYIERDDYVRNGFTGESDAAGGYDDLALRVQALFTPSSDLSWLLNVHARDLVGGQQIFRANGLATGSNDPVPGYERDVIFQDGQPFSVLTLDTLGLTSRLDWDSPYGFTVTSIFGIEQVNAYSRGDVDGGAGAAFLPTGSVPGFIPFPAETADGIDDLRQVTQEIRFANTVRGRFNWTVGLYAFDESLDINAVNFDTLGGGSVNGLATQSQKTKAYSVFGSISYELTDRLTVGGGLRYSDDEKSFVAARQLSPIGAGPLAPQFVTVGDEDVSWDVSATYAVTPDINGYARVARGFRAPSIQGRLLFGDVITTADSEVLTSYEVGVKSTLLNNRLRSNIGLFYYEIEDQQLTAIGGAGNFNQLLNADKGEAYGFEAEFDAVLTEALTLTAALSYNATEIKDAGLTVAPCGAPCTVLDPIDPATGGARINGNGFPNAPEWLGNVVLDYRVPAGDGELFATTDWAFKGETNFFLYDSVEFTADAYWEGGLRAGYATGPWQLAIFGRNITDEIGVVGAIDFNNLSIFTNAPRTVGVELRWDY